MYSTTPMYTVNAPIVVLLYYKGRRDRMIK